MSRIIPSIAKPPGSTPALVGAKMYNTNAQVVTTATNTNTTFNTVEFDTASMANTGTGRLTATVAGYYLIIHTVTFVANVTGRRISAITKNGTFAGGTGTLLAGMTMTGSLNGGNANATAITFEHLAVGDFLTGGTYQDSGGNLSTAAGLLNDWFSAALIGV